MRRQLHRRYLAFTKPQIKSWHRITRRIGLLDGHSFKQNIWWFQVFITLQLNITPITAIISRIWRTLTKVWKWLYTHIVSFFWNLNRKSSFAFALQYCCANVNNRIALKRRSTAASSILGRGEEIPWVTFIYYRMFTNCSGKGFL